MNQKEVTEIVRARGMCGFIIDAKTDKAKACLLAIGHDGGTHETVVIPAPAVFQGAAGAQEVRPRERTPLTRLAIAACEYGDSFAETDQKKESPRREDAHRRLCRAAREFAASTHEQRKAQNGKS